MLFSTILPVVFCLAVGTSASPVTLECTGGANGGAKSNGGASGGATGTGATAGAVSAGLKAKVAGTIVQWFDAINTVNNFVDTAGKVNDPVLISALAAEAFKAAQVEGNSNTLLQQDVTLDASGQAAAQALLAQFNVIGPAINDTISNPGNLKKNLNAINGARCPPPRGANAISEEAAVLAAAAKAVGVNLPPPAVPAACR